MKSKNKKGQRQIVDLIKIGREIEIRILDTDAQAAISEAVVDEHSWQCADGLPFPYSYYDEFRDDFSKCPGFQDVEDRNSVANRLFEQLSGVRLPAVLSGHGRWRGESAVMCVVDCKLVTGHSYLGPQCQFLLRGYNLYSDGRFCKDARSSIWGEFVMLNQHRLLDGSWRDIPLLSEQATGEDRYRWLTWLPGGRIIERVSGDKVVCEVKL